MQIGATRPFLALRAWSVRAALAGVAAVLGVPVFAPLDAGRAEALGEWTSQLQVVAKVGDQFISSYDVHVAVAVDRMRKGRSLDQAPDDLEFRRALAQEFHRHVVLEAAKRHSTGVPDAEAIRRQKRAIIEAYGDGDAETFWRRTGIAEPRLSEALRRRDLVKRYIQDILAPSARVADRDVRAYYAQHVTRWGSADYEVVAPRIRRLLTYRNLRDELEALRDRYVEKHRVEILSPKYRLTDLTEVDIRGAADPLESSPPTTTP